MATLTRDSHLMPNSNQDYWKGKKKESKKQINLIFFSCKNYFQTKAVGGYTCITYENSNWVCKMLVIAYLHYVIKCIL